MQTRLEKQLAFLVEIDKMKSIFRQTLLIDNQEVQCRGYSTSGGSRLTASHTFTYTSRQESDAEHSWHMALMAAVLFEYADHSKVNLTRVMKMALVHDLVEIYAGDTYAYDAAGQEECKQREQGAADKLFALLPDDQAKEIRALWEEFDAKESDDAKYASAMDSLQPFLNNYYTQGKMWKHHHVKSSQVYKRLSFVKTATPELWTFVDHIIKDSIKKGYLSE